MTQLLCHLWGDYILQSHWMATKKTTQSGAAAAHAIAYTVPFIFLTHSHWALMIIAVSHFFIDRYRLARYAVWFKNWIRPQGELSAWADCSTTGFVMEKCGGPAMWLQVWLLIIVDNTIHLTINYLALRFA